MTDSTKTASDTAALNSNSKPSASHSIKSRADGAADIQPLPDFVDYVTDYAKQKPQVAAMWCFGVGFVLGWKLKPW